MGKAETFPDDYRTTVVKQIAQVTGITRELRSAKPLPADDELDIMAGIAFTPDLGESITSAARKPEASKGEI